MNELRIFVCFLIKNFPSKSCRDSLRANSPGNFRGWGREKWEDRPGELARRLCREGKEMCESVCSLPRRGSSRVPASRRREGLRDAPKVCVGGYTVWARAKLSPSSLLTFSLPFPSPSWLFGLLITTTTWLERRPEKIARKKKKLREGARNLGRNWRPNPGGLSCKTVDCKTIGFFS